MRQKTARFNYLEDKQTPTENNIDSERYQYKHIINKLTREHQYQNVLKDYYKDQLNQHNPHSPFLRTPLPNEERKNSQIKSIILNENINLERIKTQKNESHIENRDAYRMIKESHIVKDQDFEKFFQKNKSPDHAYELPPKETIAPEPKYSYNPIKFYQIKLEQTPPKKKINSHKNNQPYINQLYIGNSSHGGRGTVNPQVRQQPSPLRLGLNESHLKNNKAYKVQKSQQKLYDIDRNRYYNDRQDARKRSCFDYVPKQLKQKLTRARQHEY